MTYRNPIISGFHPDPSICRQGDDFYLVTSSFEYFPGVPLFHSKDLIHWEQIGHCLTRPEQLDLSNARSSGGLFAPTIRYHQGTFYMITTNVSGGGNFIVRTNDPRGDWSDPMFIDQPGIDPDLFFDEDGTVYLNTSWSNEEVGQGVFQSRINIETGERLSAPVLLWKGTGGQYPEAPHIYKIGDWYYLMLAEGGTEYGHMETIARSESPQGPFEACPRNPILTHRSQLQSIHALGHADLVQAPDESWWAVFLGIRPLGYPNRHHLGREVFLAPVQWDEEGWPIVGDNGTIREVMNVNTLPLQPVAEQAVRDDFNEETLANCWNFIRVPKEENFTLAAKSSCLTLLGSAETLNDFGVPSFVGRRQLHFKMQASAHLSFAPVYDGEEAGLTVYMNDRFHYEIAVTRIAGVRKLIFRRTLGSLWKVEHEMPLHCDDVTLVVKSSDSIYDFGIRLEDRTVLWFGQGESSMLATEVAGGFTGVLIGLYATGNGKRSEAPAHIDWFDYEKLAF